MRVLGFDISSSTIGISLLERQVDTIKLLYIDYFKPPKDGDIFYKLNITKNFIKEQIEKLKPDEIAIEDFLLFMPNKSSANTITLLAIYNRVIGLLCYEILGKSPILYRPSDIRRAIAIVGLIPSKEQVPTFLELFLDIQFPWKYNKKGKPIIENHDAADGAAVALCHLLTEQDHIKLKEKIEKNISYQDILQKISQEQAIVKAAKLLKKSRKAKKPK